MWTGHKLKRDNMIKFSYLISIGLMISAAGTASADIVFERPSGTEKTYDLTTQQNYSGETYDFSGVLSTLVFDGDDVWFENPVTAFGFGSWIKGERDGDKIRVKNGQMIFHQDEGDGYPELDVSVRSGYWNGDMPWTDDADYAEFTILSDGTIVLPEGKMLLATDQYGGILASNNGYYFSPIDLKTAACNPPAGLQTEKYCLHYVHSLFREDMYRLVDLVRDDDTFYVKGLCGTYAPDGWSMGKRDGDYVKFASGQFQGIAQENFLNYMYGGHAATNGSLSGYEPDRALQFSYSSDTGVLTSSDVILETIGDRILVDSYDTPELKPYTAKEAIPAKPEMRGFTEYEEFVVVRFNISPVDENGDYIDPDGITWRLILDGKPYVFDPEIFHYLPEKKEVFKWGECDGERGIDIVFENCGMYNLWLYEDFDTMAVECTFTHEGKSHTVTSDTMLVGRSGIDTADISEKTSEIGTYTVNGIRATGEKRGIVIKTFSTSNGTMKAEKYLKF